MNVVVCIKQVPDTTEVKINPETNTLVREGVESIINPFDMYAIEEAIRIKERYGGSTTVISMGPPQTEDALRESIAMGIDKAILISDKAFAGSDTWATSYVLAQAIKKIDNFDLVLCGKQASDGDTAQVGPGISTHLNIPQSTYVKKIEQIEEGSKIRVERMVEEGFQIIELPLPALLTVVKEINEPRLPSLKGKMKAKKIDIPVWGKQNLDIEENKVGLEGSPTQVIKIFTPPPRQKGKILKGETEHVVKELVRELKSEIL